MLQTDIEPREKRLMKTYLGAEHTKTEKAKIPWTSPVIIMRGRQEKMRQKPKNKGG